MIHPKYLQSPPACIYHKDTVRVNLTQQSNWIQLGVPFQWKLNKVWTKRIGYKTLHGSPTNLTLCQADFFKMTSISKG